VKTILDGTTRNELIGRIQSLRKDSPRQWGKMNVYQMTTHCVVWNRWVLGVDNEIPYRQTFLGRLIGKFVLGNNTKNDKPLSKGVPAGSDFIVKRHSGNLEGQKAALVELIERYENYYNPAFIHDFFGEMTTEEIGVFAYKHMDHHLRQFEA
jgi:hypothetical protein